MRKGAVIKLVVGIIVIGGGISYFMFQAMQSSWSYYYSVDEFAADSAAQEHSYRLAGRVKAGSITRDLENVMLGFTLAGSEAELPVQYQGVVPDNFTDDREVVVEGRLSAAGVFQADTLMTKCESKYQAKVQ